MLGYDVSFFVIVYLLDLHRKCCESSLTLTQHALLLLLPQIARMVKYQVAFMTVDPSQYICPSGQL